LNTTKVVRNTAVAAGALLASFAAQADTFDAAVGEETVRLGLTGSLARAFGWEKGEYDVGGVYGDVEDDKHQSFFLGHLGAMLTGDAGAQSANVKAGLGARVYYLDGEDDEGGALAIGGMVRVSMPGIDRLGFQANGYFAPDASTFGDFDRLTDLGVSVGYEILKDAELYLGYRWIKTSVDHFSGTIDAEDGANIGIRLTF
jgi:hypothetical protein